MANRVATGRGGRAGRAVTTRRWRWRAGPTWPTTTMRCSSAAGWRSDLIARATRRGEADDLAGAIDDLDLAERIGAPPDVLAAARLNLADRVADEVRADLDAGEPGRVVERIDGLARHKISGPALRRTREIAEAWQIGAGRGPPRRVRPGPRPARPRRAARRRRRRAQPPPPWPRPGATSRPGRRPPPRRSRRSYAALSDGQMARDPDRGRGRPRDRPRTSRRAAGADPGLAADRGDQPVVGHASPAAADASPQSTPASEPAASRPPAKRNRPRRGIGPRFPAEVAPIVWLSPRPASLRPAAGRSGPVARAAESRPEGPVPALGRRRRRLPRLPGRSGRARPRRARQHGRRPPDGRPLAQPRHALAATATATCSGPTSRRSSTASRSRPPRSATAT